MHRQRTFGSFKMQRAASMALRRKQEESVDGVRLYRCMIDPRSHPKKLQWWDGAIAGALCWVAIVTPFEAAFLEAPSS